MEAQNTTPYFVQSVSLRRSGFRNKVYALPDEARGFIEDLLKEDRTDVFIAREVNRRYDLKNNSDVGEVSHKAIASYRKAWKKQELTKSESLRSLADFDSNFIKDFKGEIEKAKVITRMREMFDRQYESAKMFTEQEKNLPLPLQSAETARKSCFSMGVALVHTMVEAGLLPSIANKQPLVNANTIIDIGPELQKAIQSLQREIANQNIRPKLEV